MSGFMGELAGDALLPSMNNGSISRQNAIQLAGMVGGFSAILTGSLTGLDDHEIANNIWGGFRIGQNAAENNAVALYVKPDGAGGNGHAAAYLQDENGNWYYYDKNMARGVNPSTLGLITNMSYPAEIDLLDLHTAGTLEAENNLIQNPQIIYIRTTPEQDARIFQRASELSMNPDSYNLCTSNCLDSVQDIFRAGNMRYPIDFNPKPNSYFIKLRQYYPNNLTNQSYDK